MRRPLLVFALTAVLLGLIAGLYGRLDGFGLRPLAVDEYYFVQSIRNILQEGVPAFATGGHYVRGLLIQYLTAATTFVLGTTELAFRFPALLFSLASVLLTYVYGRWVVGRPAAVAVALMLLISSWQIEFARFARMYAAFQFVTLLFLAAVDDAYYRDNWKRRYVPHLLAIVAILTHELGVLLAPLLFVPLLTPRDRSRFASPASLVRFGLAGAFTTAVCVLFERVGLRDQGVVERVPDGFLPPVNPGTFRLPDFPFWSLSESGLVNLAALGGIMLIACLVFVAWKLRRHGASTVDLLAVLSVVAAATHSLMLFGILVAILVLRYRISRIGRHPQRVYVLLGLSCLLAAGWIVYALTHLERLGYASGGPGVAELIRRAFFGWPDFYLPLWLPCFREFPLLTLLLLASLLYHAATKLAGPPSEWMRHPAFFVAYIALCFGVLQSLYTETRYVFFIYPLVLYVIASALVELSQRLSEVGNRSPQPAAKWVGVTLFVGLFLLSNDFNPRHIARVASDDVTYRMGVFERFRSTWYPRRDYRSAAEFVNLHEAGGDRSAIVVVAQPPVSYYLDSAHAVYYSRADRRFVNVSRDRGTVELWSNQRLLSTPDELRRYTSNATVVWLVETPESKPVWLDAESVWGERLHSKSAAFQSVDGRLQVTRVVLE